jgi:hypothetical protein
MRLANFVLLPRSRRFSANSMRHQTVHQINQIISKRMPSLPPLVGQHVEASRLDRRAPV